KRTQLPERIRVRAGLCARHVAAPPGETPAATPAPRFVPSVKISRRSTPCHFQTGSKNGTRAAACPYLAHEGCPALRRARRPAPRRHSARDNRTDANGRAGETT